MAVLNRVYTALSLASSEAISIVVLVGWGKVLFLPDLQLLNKLMGKTGKNA